jgi:hypothetical protein
MNWIKDFTLLSVSISFCFCVLVTGDWLFTRQINLAIAQQTENSEAEKAQEARRRNEDVPQRAKLISEGFLPVVYPSLMDTLDIRHPLIAGLPLAKTYYCNEGYGVLKYQSDRFGFRNKDIIWDDNPKIIMIGDSFVHGACVSDEETLPQKLSNEIKSNVANLGIGGNGPSHYFTYAYLFIPRLNPQIVYLNFFTNDNGIGQKSSIERKYVDLNVEIFAKNSLSFIDASLFFDQGMRIIDYLRDEKSTENEIQENSLAYRAFNAFKRHSTLPTIKSLIGFTEHFKQTENAITKTSKLCDEFNCELIVSFIPNSEYYTPDPRANSYADKIKQLTSKLGLHFVDGREFLDRKKDSEDFAVNGPHLSPIGYEKMAKAIAEVK